MQIKLTGLGFDITPAVRSSVTEKFNRLQHHFDKITSIDVICKVKKITQTAEATVHVAKANTLHASSESNDNMYSAIDSLVDKLHRQITKHKEKLKNHRE